MSVVVVLAPGLSGRALRPLEGIRTVCCADVDSVLAAGGGTRVVLLVVAGMPVEDQCVAVERIRERRPWRVVPVLYVISPGFPGTVVPGAYRPELDRFVSGTVAAARVRSLIRSMALEGAAAAGPVAAGPHALDPQTRRFRVRGAAVDLTESEARLLALLLARPNEVVPLPAVVTKTWGGAAGVRGARVVRRHLSNLRRKLEAVAGAPAIENVRGAGYRLNVPELAPPGQADRRE